MSLRRDLQVVQMSISNAQDVSGHAIGRRAPTQVTQHLWKGLPDVTMGWEEPLNSLPPGF